jgi:hypothetical protein
VSIPVTFLADVRSDLYAVLFDVLEPEVTVWELPPDDVMDVPAVFIDLLTPSKGFEVAGSTVVRASMVIVAHRTDTPSSVTLLEEVVAQTWVALGAGNGILLPFTKGQLRAMTAVVSNEQVGDTTWPTYRIDADIIVMSGYC